MTTKVKARMDLLPPELLSSIISLSIPPLISSSLPVTWSERATTLRSLALINHRLRIHAQHELFSHIAIQSFDALQSFLEVIQADADLAKIPRFVCIDGGRRGSWNYSDARTTVLIKELLESCQEVTELSLRHKKLNLDVLVHPRIHTLTVWGSYLSGRGTSPLPSLPSLQALSLDLVQIEPHGPELLSSFLTSINSSLRYLSLTQVAMGFDPLRSVNTGITSCQHLDTLEIDVGLASHLRLSGLREEVKVIYRFDRSEVSKVKSLVEEIEAKVKEVYLVDPWLFSAPWVKSFRKQLPNLKKVMLPTGFGNGLIEIMGKEKGFEVTGYDGEEVVREALSRAIEV